MQWHWVIIIILIILAVTCYCCCYRNGTEADEISNTPQAQNRFRNGDDLPPTHSNREWMYRQTQPSAPPQTMPLPPSETRNGTIEAPYPPVQITPYPPGFELEVVEPMPSRSGRSSPPYPLTNPHPTPSCNAAPYPLRNPHSPGSMSRYADDIEIRQLSMRVLQDSEPHTHSTSDIPSSLPTYARMRSYSADDLPPSYDEAMHHNESQSTQDRQQSERNTLRTSRI